MELYREIDLNIFPKERQNKLESIFRYNFFDTMFYRSNLWEHSHRVLWLLEEIAPIAKKYINFDIEKARIYALVHDDAEMITGDIQAIVKARMTKDELKELEKKDSEAVSKLATEYPENINGYSYKSLLNEAIHKNSIESKLVSYLDKLDAFCESLHDLYAGNLSLLRSVVFYSMTLPSFPRKYPELKELLESKESTLTFINDQISPYEIKFEKYKNFGKPHTELSIHNNTDFPFYKTWKEIIISRGKIDWLIKQREK